MRKTLPVTALAGVAAAAALVGSGLSGPTATAAPPVVTPPAPTPTALVTGVLGGPSKARQDGISLKVRGEVTVRDFTLVYPAGAVSGWHRHPGIVLATVKKGEVVQQVGCHRYTWKAGQSFTEVKPHQVSNRTSKRAVLRITQILPVDAPTRTDTEPPSCRPHS